MTVTADGCWQWTGTTIRTGYGMVWSSEAQKQVLAHRRAWEVWRTPIPAGMEIDHLCQNRPCINPDHIEVVTPHENKKRRWDRQLDRS
jgi:hypothetical protein